MARLNAWRDVCQKVVSRLSKCKVKALSIGGILTLLKSVLGSVPSYYFSFFKAPIGILAKLESLIRSFSLVLMRVLRNYMGLVGIRSWLPKRIGVLGLTVSLLSTKLSFLNGCGGFLKNLILYGVT